MNKRRNESADFVGTDRLKSRHAAQVETFEEWAKERQWNMFHHSHYDWWTFPYGCHSGAYGAAYAIYEHEAQLLRQDEEFIGRFLRRVELLMLSWGWDLRGRCNAAYQDRPELHVWQP